MVIRSLIEKVRQHAFKTPGCSLNCVLTKLLAHTICFKLAGLRISIILTSA